MKLVELNLNKISFHNTDIIDITLDIKDYTLETKNLTNININIYELGEKRNEFVFGFASEPKIKDDKLYISQKLSNSLKDGIYLIRHIKLIYEDKMNNNHYTKSLLPKDDFELKFFHITEKKENQSISKDEIKQRIEKISVSRNAYRNKVILTTKASDHKDVNSYQVLIFAIGCLLHTVQELHGFTIYPLSDRLDYSHMHNPVNEYISKKFGFSLPYNEKINIKFKNSTPLFVIDYPKVVAKDLNDAIQYCDELSDTIFSILAYDKGQRPNMFSFVVRNTETGEYSYDFQFPGYKGNLISDFSPSATANKIDNFSPILNSNPWVKFIFDSYSYAINERNIDLKYFRLWAILELIAKNEIISDSQEIVDAKNNPIQYISGEIVKTKNTLAKVYHLVYNSDLTQATTSSSIPNSKYYIVFESNQTIAIPDGAEKISLWKSLNAMYAIRNATAHQGKFIIEDAKKGTWRDKLASKYYIIGHSVLLNELERIVKHMIKLQIDKNS